MNLDGKSGKKDTRALAGTPRTRTTLRTGTTHQSDSLPAIQDGNVDEVSPAVFEPDERELHAAMSAMNNAARTFTEARDLLNRACNARCHCPSWKFGKRQRREHRERREKRQRARARRRDNPDASSVTRLAILAETVLLAGKARHVLTALILLVSVVLLACSSKFPRVLVCRHLPRFHSCPIASLAMESGTVVRRRA